MTYFKRATAYLSLGRHHAAVDDFSTLLDLKPDFDNAFLQRARIYTKEGNFDLALQDLKTYLKRHMSDKKAQSMVQLFFFFLHEIFFFNSLFSYKQYNWLKMP